MKYITMAILFMTPLDALARGCRLGCGNTDGVGYFMILVLIVLTWITYGEYKEGRKFTFRDVISIITGYTFFGFLIIWLLTS